MQDAPEKLWYRYETPSMVWCLADEFEGATEYIRADRRLSPELRERAMAVINSLSRASRTPMEHESLLLLRDILEETK